MSEDEWFPQQTNGRRNNALPDRFHVQRGSRQPPSIWNNGNAALLMLNSLMFGEDESINGLIQQEMNPQMLCNELADYPFQFPPEDIYGPINTGYSEVNGNPAGIYPGDVHLLIVGASNMGKSTLNRHVMRGYMNAGIPILVIDFENEYPALLNDARINVLGVDTLRWNPLEVPPGMDPILYRQMFCSVFSDQLGLLIASKGFLLKAVDALYKLYGVYDGSGNYPSMFELADFLKKMLERQKSNTRTYTYGEVCLNRAEGFTLALPHVLDCSTGMPLHTLTRGHTILSLHGIDFEYQALFVNLILSWLCCHRIANGLRNNPTYDLAVFIDEAQRLFDAQLERRQYQGIPTISHLIATVRKYNLKICVSAQQPSLLASSIKANSFCKIMLALGEGGDIMDMGTSMFLTPEQTYYSRKLERGQAIVKFSGRWTEPFIIRIPYEE
ncbi:ATP-binding protein [Candidatus Poribacteria bacterium]